MQKLRTMATIFLVALMFIFALREFPIGTGSSFPYEMNGSASVSISRPRYLIPREIWLTGWPLPGGDAGVSADPHYSASAPGQGKTQVNGIDEIVRFQGFMINPRFSNEAYKDSILAYGLLGQRFETRTIGVDYTDLSFPSAIVLIGQLNDNLSFLLAGSPPRIILAPMIRSTSVTNAKLLTPADAEWESTIEILRKKVKQEEFARFCNSATKSVIAFWKKELMLACPTP